MPADQFHVVANNPNIDGGGCLCSETGHADQEGPFVVFAVDTDSSLSPRSVLCAGCLRSASAAVEGEVLAGGEVIDVTYEDVTTSDPTAGDSGAVPEDLRDRVVSDETTDDRVPEV